MDRELGRRALFSGLVGAGTAGIYFSAANGPLRQFAPLSGSVWESARADRGETVDSPYGSATVRYDEAGVPHVSADDEQALYFAVGYTQGTDRLFQMDLQRRLYRGQLSAIVGAGALDTDRFHRQMAFGEAAEVTAENLDGTAVAPILDAYADGVNAAMENETLSLGFKLLDYEPAEWTRTDTALIEKIIAWQLTGSFRTLETALVRERLGELFTEERGAALTEALVPSRFDDVSPILRDHHDVGEFTVGDGALDSPSAENRSAPDKTLVDWVKRFEPPEAFGSNSWVVGPELTEGDAPILSNDPHLGLQAPPTWYEMHIDGPDHRARGVTFPGAPVVVIGENDDGAWGFTNANADVIDFYQYDHDNETYQYGDERREFDVQTEEIEVDGGPNEEVERRRTVHGPVIEEDEQEVGVAWTGHTATETMLSLYELSHSGGVDDAVAAAERFDSPTQNMVYADRDGNTLYYMTGRVPIRRTDGEMVRGDQIFDGSAREGEWEGFEPFGESSWEGFVPRSANPKVRNPEYLATANQQIVPDDQLDYYLSDGYASPYRGRRIYDLLDRRVASGEPIDAAFLQEVARDTFDGRAAVLVDSLVEAARGSDDDELDDVADTLDSWDYHLDADSRAALVWVEFFDTYRDEIFEEAFEDADLDSSYYPQDAALVQLDEDSPWFGSRSRKTVMRAALKETVAEIEAMDAEVYGDVNHTGHISHLTELDFLDYPSYSRGGSDQTVWNYDRTGPWGGSWEMHADLDGDLFGILPGGNSGRYFSDHYDDQLERWANGEYRTLSREPEGDVAVEFEGGDE